MIKFDAPSWRETSSYISLNSSSHLRKLQSILDIFESCTFTLIIVKPSKYEVTQNKGRVDNTKKEKITTVEKSDL